MLKTISQFFLSDLLVKISNVALTIALVTRFTLEESGLYAIAISTGAIIASISDFGLSQNIQKYSISDRNTDSYSFMIGIQPVLLIFHTLALVLIFIYSYQYAEKNHYLIFILVYSVLLSQYKHQFVSFLRGIGDSFGIFILSLIQFSFYLSVAIILYTIEIKFLYFTILLLTINLLPFLLYVIYSYYNYNLIFKWNTSYKMYLIIGAPFALQAICVVLYNNFPQQFVNNILGNADGGKLYIINYVFNIVNLLFSSIIFTIVPIFRDLFTKKKITILNKLFSITIIFYTIFCSLFSIIFIYFWPIISEVIFRKNIDLTSEFVLLFFFSQILIYFSTLINSVSFFLNQRWKLLYNSIIVLLVSFVLYFYFIKNLNFFGVSLALFMSELLSLILAIYVFSNISPKIKIIIYSIGSLFIINITNYVINMLLISVMWKVIIAIFQIILILYFIHHSETIIKLFKFKRILSK